ncbi:hypothetical protein TWF225_005240 [Orbilia oligospora]|nr:hypothetical protein TWF225_005240 [Orbilia oligospora]KAF3252385.1 hypothetical protein TWF128_006749 [Orbilia oligospora]KAF3258089.1 hypothetical protein TWF217_005790 [Orbilia oligospora]KAF3289175.1 hypothetical protein TWF132_007622 [Orbilia oligospora]
MPPTGSKRPFSGSGSGPHRTGPKPQSHNPQQPQQPAPTGPYISMFTAFRNELDEHQDRRERIIKASRDITAASKKIIFSLQRLRPTTLPLTTSLPQNINNEILQYESKIQDLLASIIPDLQGLDGPRWQRQISPGLQEYIEAIGFRHYLLKRKVMEWEEADWYVSGLHGDEILGREKKSEEVKEVKEDVEMIDVVSTQPIETSSIAEGGCEKKKEEKKDLKGIQLTKEDYVLGLYDMTGEMMRFAITSVATTPLAQLLGAAKDSADGKAVSTPQCLLQDLRTLQSAFEGLDVGFTAFGKDADKKLRVMQDSVKKVEYAFYGMVVRGSERPEGWVADFDASGGGGGGGDNE